MYSMLSSFSPTLAMSPYFAHSANAAGQWHDLAKHLRDVADRARTFAAKFGAGEFAYWAGLWHDLGKFSEKFQDYIAGKEPRGPDHSSAGAVLAARHFDGLAFLVAGHHVGLDSVDGLKKRLSAKRSDPAVEKALDLACAAIPSVMPTQDLSALLPDFARPRQREDRQALRNRELYLRMLFAALVDADFLDTELHFRADLTAQRGAAPSLQDIWRQFEADQAGLTGKEASPLQRARGVLHVPRHLNQREA